MGKKNHPNVGTDWQDAFDEMKIKKYAEEIQEHATKDMGDFPEDKEDEQRRFLEIVGELQSQGLLSEEEIHRVLGENSAGKSTGDYGNKTAFAKENTLSGEGPRKGAAGAPEKEEKPRRRFPRDFRKGNIRYAVGKWAAIFAVTCVGTFTVSMSSQANRQHFSDTVRYIVGNDVRVKVNNDAGALKRGMTEVEAREEIEKNLEIEVPIIKYKPSGMKFVGFEIYEENGDAIIFYEYLDNKIVLRLSDGEKAKIGAGAYGGGTVQEVKINRGLTTAYMYNTTGKDSKYGIEWNYGEAYYWLGGVVEKEEFLKISEKILF